MRGFDLLLKLYSRVFDGYRIPKGGVSGRGRSVLIRMGEGKGWVNNKKEWVSA